MKELKLGQNKRVNFSDRIEKLEIPNLSNIQKGSYQKLEDERLEYIFSNYFPVTEENGEMEFRYKGFFFDKSDHSFVDEIEYKNRGLNYTRPLKITIELYNVLEGISIETKDVFLCDLPIITERGTFIINGVERVVVSQLVRSPGLYVTKEKDKTTTDDKITGQIMPTRGTRLSLEQRYTNNIFSGQQDVVNQIQKVITASEEQDLGEEIVSNAELLLKATIEGRVKSARDFVQEAKKEILKNKIKFQFDSQRKVSLMTFTRFIGMSNENIYSILGDNRIVRDNLMSEENTTFDDVVKVLVNSQVINAPITEEIDLDYKKDVDNIFLTLEEQNIEIPADIDEYFDKITNEELEQIVIDSVDNEYQSKIKKFLNLCKSSGINIEVTLFKKNEHTYRQKRKTYNDLMARFIGRSYNFGEVGRFKFNLKVDLVKNTLMNVNSRFYNAKLAEDMVSPKDKKLKLNAGDIINHEKLMILNKILIDGYGIFEEIIENKELGINYKVTLQKVRIVSPINEEELDVIGIINSDDQKMHLDLEDILVYLNYFVNVAYKIGKFDDKDHLANRRVRLVGELVEQEFSRGLYEIEKNVKRYGFQNIQDEENNNIIGKVFTTNRFNNSIQRFFSSSQLSQFMDQTNPLAELTHKRRLSALGPGGISRERATMEVRDVHHTHYGRVCPIESPEGGNIGLISSLTVYAQINENGFIETPYLKLEKKYDKKRNFKTSYLTGKIEFISAIDEDRYCIGQSTVKINEKTGEILDLKVASRYNGINSIRNLEVIDYIEISPKQIFSAGTGLIPFLEHDDANRALMGANMQRQAVPLMISEAPIVGTTMEHHIGKDSGSVVTAKVAGVVVKVNSKQIDIKTEDGEIVEHKLIKYLRTNHSTIVNHSPIVKIGQQIEFFQVIADGNAMENGELALGKNVTVAFLTWDGYNYEDAIIISDRLVKEDVYTSIHIEEHVCEVIQTKLGMSQITRDIPNVGEDAKKHLDEMGIVVEGTKVVEGDILVGKVIPKAKTDPTPEERLLFDVLGEKTKDVKDESLRVLHGGGGIVQKVLFYDVEEDELDVATGIKQVVKVYIAQKRKIQEGDKMAGRHGNKGVISRVLPQEDMPYLEDGTPVDIMLNPLGVPSRMNIGQVLEMHLGMVGKILGLRFATEVFEGVKEDELQKLMAQAGMQKSGKFKLFDGRTGESFNHDVTVGVMYILKLAHMVEDKMHARAIGPYALVTQQPLGGKAQFGGQRFGEMEVWALEAYGAANLLQEMMTLKSDDIFGRSKMYDALLKSENFDEIVVPESYNVLLNEIRGLGIDLGMYDKNGKEIKLTDLIEY